MQDLNFISQSAEKIEFLGFDFLYREESEVMGEPQMRFVQLIHDVDCSLERMEVLFSHEGRHRWKFLFSIIFLDII